MDLLGSVKDVREAEATQPEDKNFVLKFVEENVDGGCDAINSHVLEGLGHFLREHLLRSAVRTGDIDAITQLNDRIDVTAIVDAAGETPLHWAASIGQPAACRLLLSLGVPPRARNHRGLDAMELASCDGHHYMASEAMLECEHEICTFLKQ